MDQYVYKITNDDGGAPCVHDGILSLAICKPRIRVPAGTFDWVFGFGGVHLGEKLIYIAQVTSKARHGSYYRDDEYAGRPDRIYTWRGPFLRCLPNRFHPDGKWGHLDIGEYPNYERAEVLLSTNFRYFGAAARPTTNRSTRRSPRSSTLSGEASASITRQTSVASSATCVKRSGLGTPTAAFWESTTAGKSAGSAR